jgi:hypothetical protein
MLHAPEQNEINEFLKLVLVFFFFFSTSVSFEVRLVIFYFQISKTGVIYVI